MCDWSRRHAELFFRPTVIAAIAISLFSEVNRTKCALADRQPSSSRASTTKTGAQCSRTRPALRRGPVFRHAVKYFPATSRQNMMDTAASTTRADPAVGESAGASIYPSPSPVRVDERTWAGAFVAEKPSSCARRRGDKAWWTASAGLQTTDRCVRGVAVVPRVLALEAAASGSRVPAADPQRARGAGNIFTAASDLSSRQPRRRRTGAVLRAAG